MRGDFDAGPGEGGSTAGTILLILFGPILWAMHFGLVYLVQSMLCAHDFAASAIAPVVLLATLAFIAPIAVAIAAPERIRRAFNAGGWGEDEHAFQRRVTMLLAVLSGFGVAWAGMTALIVPACQASLKGAMAESEPLWAAFVG